MTLKEAIALYESVGKSFELWRLRQRQIENWKAKQRIKAKKPRRKAL